jgi:hypothetical protein
LFLATLLKMLTTSNTLLEFVGFPKDRIISSTNRNNLTSYFPTWILLISFSCLIDQSKNGSFVLGKSGKSGYPCLMPDFRENALVPAHLLQFLDPFNWKLLEICVYPLDFPVWLNIDFQSIPPWSTGF